MEITQQDFTHQCGGVSHTLFMAAACKLEENGQQEEIRHRYGADLRVHYLLPAGTASYMAYQRNGNHAYDARVLSDAGEPGRSACGAYGTEDVNALSEKSGQSTFLI